jgi:hypothetical protein
VVYACSVPPLPPFAQPSVSIQLHLCTIHYARILIHTKGLRCHCSSTRFDCVGRRIGNQECQSRSHIFRRIVRCYLYVSAPFIQLRRAQASAGCFTPHVQIWLTCRLKEPAPLPSAIELAEGGTLKFTFTAIDTTSGSAIQPKQAHLLFEDLKGEEDVTLPVTIKENGKASFTIVRLCLVSGV